MPSPKPDAHVCLERWTACRDEAALARLLALHGDLVFSTALRILDGQRMLAEEVAQTVFAVMARKASSLRHHPSLAAWLHRAAVLEALQVRRRERTRLAHLAEFSRQAEMAHAASPWPAAGPEVDLALERLAASDRRLLCLRFYEERSFPEIARHLGKSEAAIRKATSRALARLARLLGVEDRPATASTLAAPLAVLAAPGGFSPAPTAGFAPSLLHQADRLTAFRLFTHSMHMAAVGKSTTTLAVAALLLLLSVGGSYSLGLAQARAKQETHAASGLADAANRTGPPKPPPIRSGGAGGTAAISLSLAQIREMLTAVAKEYDTDAHGVTGFRFSTNLPARLAAFDHTCVPAALEMLPEFRGNPKEFESTAGLIIAAWAERDLAAARAGLEDPRLLRHDGKISGLAVRMVMEQWAVTEPVAALQWALNMVDSGRSALDPAIGVGARLFKDWAKSDSQGAFDELSRRAAAQPKLAADGVTAIAKNKETQPIFLDRLLSPDATAVDRAQALSLGRLALQWAKPEYRKPMLDQLSLPPAIREELLKDL